MQPINDIALLLRLYLHGLLLHEYERPRWYRRLSPSPTVVPLTYRPSFSPSPPPSSAFKLRFFLFEALFVAILLYAVPVGVHDTVVSISIGNLFAVTWFWYNSVRCVDVTDDSGLPFWIRNIELDVPYNKITGLSSRPTWLRCSRGSGRGRGARGGQSGRDRCDARG